MYSYSAIRGGDESNKSEIIKIGPAVLELGINDGTNPTCFIYIKNF